MREELLGATYDGLLDRRSSLDERFDRRGAYFIPEGALDWEAAAVGARCMPEPIEARRRRAWRPGDELFVPCRDSEGEILAIISLGEPVSGRRATDNELDFLVAVGRHAALALEQAHRTAEARRHRAALEHLLAVSPKLAEKDSIESVMQAGLRRRPRRRSASRRSCIELVDPATGMLAPRASAGWPPGEEPRWERRRGDRRAARPRVRARRLLPAALRGRRRRAPAGVAELRRRTSATAAARARGTATACSCRCATRPARSSGASGPTSPRTGSCRRRRASRRSRCSPARRDGDRLRRPDRAAARARRPGPADRRCRNRRAFMRELEHEVERARRYGHPLTLVDRRRRPLQADQRHARPPGGRPARCAQVADTLRAGLRTSDGAFRLGGDEFALLLPETTREEAAAVVRRLDIGVPQTASEAFADLHDQLRLRDRCRPTAADAEALIRRGRRRALRARSARGRRGRRRRRRRPGRERRVGAQAAAASAAASGRPARGRRARRRRPAASCPVIQPAPSPARKRIASTTSLGLAAAAERVERR